MKPFLFAVLAAITALSACQKQVPSAGTLADQPVATGDTSQNAIDWAGTYEGMLPCADCAGIRTKLTLKEPDTFALTEDYLGKGSSPFVSKGKFAWDASGSVITINTKPDARKFKVGEGRIWHLDQEGKVITGDLAGNYILVKKQ